MEKIIQQKISADHLMYVSMKYTKTCDVMVNLIKRWNTKHLRLTTEGIINLIDQVLGKKEVK